jgi:hypothetical protein
VSGVLVPRGGEGGSRTTVNTSAFIIRNDVDELSLDVSAVGASADAARK